MDRQDQFFFEFDFELLAPLYSDFPAFPQKTIAVPIPAPMPAPAATPAPDFAATPINAPAAPPMIVRKVAVDEEPAASLFTKIASIGRSASFLSEAFRRRLPAFRHAPPSRGDTLETRPSITVPSGKTTASRTDDAF